MRDHIVDLTKLPPVGEIDRGVLLAVEQDLMDPRAAIIAHIGRFNSGYEYYAPVETAEEGGMLSLSENQVRQLHGKLGQLISEWDGEGW